MRPLSNKIVLFTLLQGFTLWANAVGERLIDDVLRSDFIFAKSESSVPFFPLGQLQFTNQDNYTIRNACNGEDCSFNYKNASQSFGLPVWVGQKNMLILGESVELDAFKSDDINAELYSAGLLAAWIGQPTEHWQYGAFVYGWKGFGGADQVDASSGSVTGAVGRYTHRDTFHTYWGLIRFAQSGQNTYYPYAGFDWLLSERWSISAVLPWPTITYSPRDRHLIKAGLLMSGSNWLMTKDGRLQSGDFEAWDLGLGYGYRLTKIIWLELSTGYSGAGRLSLQTSTEKTYQDRVGGTPFLRLAFTLRPAI